MRIDDLEVDLQARKVTRWDMNFDSDANVVEVAIKRVRAKVDAPYPRKLLHTVRGMGYVLESREVNDRQVSAL